MSIKLLCNEEAITEGKSITFENKMYPNDGWMVFLAGGAGSGKSYTLDKQIMIDGKVIDIDKLSMLYLKLIRKILDNPATPPEKKEEFLRPFGGKYPNLSDSKDTDLLHKLASSKKWATRTLQLTTLSPGSVLPNIIVDSTGNRPYDLNESAEMYKFMGYKTSIIWVITNFNVARRRNTSRGRNVNLEYVHWCHREIANKLPTSLSNGSLSSFDEAWLIFSKDELVAKAAGVYNQQYKDEFLDTTVKLVKDGNRFVIDDDLLNRIINQIGEIPVLPGEEKYSENTNNSNSKLGVLNRIKKLKNRV